MANHLERTTLRRVLVVMVTVMDALETLSVDLPETIDLLLLDGAKALYPEILSLVPRTSSCLCESADANRSQ